MTQLKIVVLILLNNSILQMKANLYKTLVNLSSASVGKEHRLTDLKMQTRSIM